MEKLFQIYRSSAGSGKTRTLAKEYLKLALRFRSDYFKHILAVTFTNKSTQEMKDRIMDYLDAFANERNSNGLADELQKELGIDAQTFQNNSSEVQANILHNYHQFSISTIDAFFQKVIRSFTREAGILGDYRLEIDNDEVMEQVISNLIDELGENKQLTDWVVELAMQNLENDRSWDMRQSLTKFSNEIFREEFKDIEASLNEVAQQENFFSNTLELFRTEKFQFINSIINQTNKIISQFNSLNLKVDDFKYKSRGSIFNTIVKISNTESIKEFSKIALDKAENEFQEPENWIHEKNPRYKELSSIAEQQWLPLLNEILALKERKLTIALSAELALDNFYAFGLLTDISRKLSEFKKENNVMLLAEAPQFLNGIISDSDTPFIYEKSGSFYKNFLIDEFQDTSGLQWKNFQPLLSNSLDSGHKSLIVGDVKQAIYRWRGSNQSLLLQAQEIIGKERTEEKILDNNFRSSKEVVEFNNALFRSSIQTISAELGLSLAANEYKDVKQNTTKTDVGFVKVQFIAEQKDADEKWNDIALQQTVLQIEELQTLGAKPNEIAILVRKNGEGQKIISHLLEHKNSDKAKTNCKYEVVSNESLRIDNAASVNLLVAALTHLLNPHDQIACAQLTYEYARQKNDPDSWEKKWSEVFADSKHEIEKILPGGFSKQKDFFKKLPLFELTETLIDIFDLKKNFGELTYLLAFQNLVLEFANRERNDINAFLIWWEDNKHKKSIVAPASENTMQLFTMHKSKGLQFKYVIIPFCSWNLDHDNTKAPNLWVKSDEPIFKELGFLPVKYSSTLEESLFAQYYKEERSRIFIDNFNLLYVAFTRAEKGLIVFAPDSTIRGQKSTIARLLSDGIQRSDELLAKFDSQTKTFSLGEFEIDLEKKNKIDSYSISLNEYNTSSWRTKLIIKHTVQEQSAVEDSQRKKINYGIHLHSAFAKVIYEEDFPKEIDKLELQGHIHSDERDLLLQQVKTLLQNPQVADWFSAKWQVRNEVHMLLPGGKEYRIDRLLLNDKQAVVIDFKTGKPKKEDREQINEYCAMLNQMNFVSEGYLLYLNEGKIEKV